MGASEKTVLVVDDDEATRKVACRLVESRGYRTLTASNGNEALEILRKGKRVDLVLLDVVMPGLDGFQTLDEANKLGLLEMPVVMLTAQTGEAQILGGYSKGATLYLTKPVRPTYLVNAVDYLIGDVSPEEHARLERSLYGAEGSDSRGR